VTIFVTIKTTHSLMTLLAAHLTAFPLQLEVFGNRGHIVVSKQPVQTSQQPKKPKKKKKKNKNKTKTKQTKNGPTNVIVKIHECIVLLS
jgi:hypothetical protein